MNRENPKTSLLIFDNFQIDNNLPKYKKDTDKPVASIVPLSGGPQRDLHIDGSMTERGVSGLTSNGSNFIISTAATSVYTNLSVFSGGTIVQVGTPNVVGEYTKESIFAKLYRWICRKKKEIEQAYETKTVKYVFDAVLTQQEKLTAFDEKNQTYTRLIQNAKELGQTALVEQLEAEQEVRKFENDCILTGVELALTEKQLLMFAEKCEKGLKLDWVKNFARLIPQEALDKKRICDEAGLFDNYVVLYYDPENRCTKMTKEEVEKAKDPILFGVMRGSRKLYFIHDWKDELCDLTMKQIADKMSTENFSLEFPPNA
jgi:hypothetical protein